MIVEVLTNPALAGAAHGFLGRRGGVSVGLLGGLIGVHQSLALSALTLLAALLVLSRVCSRGHLG